MLVVMFHQPECLSMRLTLPSPDSTSGEGSAFQKSKGPKGKGLRNVLDKTEPDAAVPVVGAAPVPVRCTQAPRSVEPEPAPDHTESAFLLILSVITVLHPFPDIPAHVIESESVGFLPPTDSVRLASYTA